MATEALGELPHGKIFPPRQVDRPLPAALAGVALGNIG
jgi:hypothetical protein